MKLPTPFSCHLGVAGLFPRISVLVASLAMLYESSWAAPSISQTTLTLKARGAKDTSPVAQSIAGAEYGDPDVRKYIAAQKDIAARLQALREQSAPPMPPNPDWNQRVRPIQEMVDTIEVAQAAYAKQKAGIGALKEGHAGMGIAVDAFTSLLGAGGGQLRKVSTRVGSKVATGAASLSASEAIERISASYAKGYVRTLEDAVSLAVLQSDQAVALKWAKVGVSENNRAQAMKELLGPQQEFFDHELMKVLGPDAKADIANAKADIVVGALARFAAKYQQGQAALDTYKSQVDQRLNNQTKAFDTVSKDVAQFRQQLDLNTQALSALAKYTETGFETINAGTGAIQNAMWRQMSPAEQLRALDDGFLPSVQGAKRKRLREDLASTVAILSARDSAMTGLSAAGSLGRMAATLGLPVDTYNLNRNIETASSAVNLVSSLAMGNWMGALDSMGGLFGGGGPDPTQAALGEIKQQLAEVLKLQREILARLDALSEQLARSTQLLMQTLADIESKVDINNKLVVNQVLDGHFACGTFIRTAQESYHMRSGIFPSYAQRAGHFSIQTNMDYFVECHRFLNGPLKSLADKNGNNPDSLLGRPTIVHPLLLAEVNEITRTLSDPNSLQSRFGRMRDYTMLALGIDIDAQGKSKAKPNCKARMLAGAVAAPVYFSQTAHSGFGCSDDDITELELDDHMRNRAGDPIDPVDALSDALAPAAVRQIGEFMLFISPYMELIRVNRNNNPKYVMLTEAQLIAGAKNRGLDGREVFEWPDFFLDVINLALAQETIHSGLLVTKVTADLLIQHKFGEGATFPPEDGKLEGMRQLEAQVKALRGYCTPHSELWLQFSYATAVCLMQQNPAFKANVVHYLVGKRLFDTGTSVFEYAFALTSADGSHIRRMLPGLPLEYTKDGERTGWFLQLGGVDGKKLRLALPSAAEVRSNQIAYRANGYLLRELREVFMERLVLASPKIKALTEDQTKTYYLRQTALSDSSFARVNFTVKLPEPAKPPQAAAR